MSIGPATWQPTGDQGESWQAPASVVSRHVIPGARYQGKLQHDNSVLRIISLHALSELTNVLYLLALVILTLVLIG